MPEKPRKKTTARTKTAPKRTAATKPAGKTVPPPVEASASPPTAQGGVCPRCGTSKFGPEQRIRVEGNRTVRYTILVCERGHTFARPLAR